MDHITLNDAIREIAQTHYSVWIGAAAAILVFVAEFWMIKKGLIFSSDEKKIDKAIADGHVIKAARIKFRYEVKDDSGKTANRLYISTYEYTMGEEKKRYRVVTRGTEAPFFISLYYEKTPKKVFSEYDRKQNPFVFLIYLIPIAVALLVMHLLGFSA